MSILKQYLVGQKTNRPNPMKDKQTPKIKDKYKIENWSSYNEALKSRGSITIWMSQPAIDTWEYQEEREPGGKIV